MAETKQKDLSPYDRLATFLHVGFYGMAGLDYTLTKTALARGFVELNPFTNTTSLITHLLLLCTITSILFTVCILSKREETKFVATLLLITLNIIWLANNIISIVLLTQG